MFNDISRKCITENNTEFHAITSNVEFLNYHYEQFHGIPWNLECANFDDTSSSMEFLGIPWNLGCANFDDPTSSMEFHAIPRNCSCHRNLRTPSSMEFHGTARVIEIGALQVSWKSMEFHGGIPWKSMELLLSTKLAHFEFHGIPWWNCSCNLNWRTPSSMNFHGIFFCYLMEPLASWIIWVLNLDRIPWNMSFQILKKIISTFAEWINFRKLISTLYRFVSLFHQLMFYYQYLHHTICISGIIRYLLKYNSKYLFNARWNLFWSKSSMELFPEFRGTFWTTLEQHLWFHGIPWNLSNKTSSSMEFHGIPWSFVQIQSSMEFHGAFSILPISIEFHGTFYIPPKSSMEFHRIPWNIFWSSIEFHGIPWNFFWSSIEFHGIPWNLINFDIKKNHISKYCCWYQIDD